MRLELTIALPKVEGRIDHLALDTKRNHLFVAALGNDSLEVVDLGAGKHLQSLTGHREPQGVAYIAGDDRVVVSNGQGEGCDVYDADKLDRTARATIGGDCDNVRYDAAAKLVWVGYGDGALASFDAGTGDKKSEVALAGHPESFQLEAHGPRIFVNVPGAHCVAVIDREKAALVATWPIETATRNYPMALDESKSRLYIGCRSPARLLVLDTKDGKVLGDVELAGDVDDLFIDAARARLIAICGEGFLDVFDIAAAAKRTDHIATAPGARTGMLDADHSKLYLAVPKRGETPAEIRVYDLKR
jgi:outer membrane protein assembly factor BamB